MKNANDPQLRALRERAGRMRLPPLVLLLPRLLGETGLVLAQSAADVLALLFSLLLTRGIWHASPLTDGRQGITMDDKQASSSRAKR